MPRDVLVSLVLLAADAAPSPDSSTAIIVAIVGPVGGVLVALIGLLGTRLVTRGRTDAPTAPTPPPPPLAEDDVDHEAALERFVMRLGFDPNKVKDGDEWPNDVRFWGASPHDDQPT